MSVHIEFFCPHCESELRVAASRGGKQSHCPVCSEMLWIPTLEERAQPLAGSENVSAFDEGAAWEAGSASSAGARPSLTLEEFQSHPQFPQDGGTVTQIRNRSWEAEPPMCALCGMIPAGQGRDCEECLQLELLRDLDRPARFHEILISSWRVYQRNFGLCLAAALLDVLLSILAMLLVLGASLVTFFAFAGLPALQWLAMIAVLAIGAVVAFAAMSVGHYRFFHRMARGEQVSLEELFRMERGIPEISVCGVAYWALVIAGLALFVVPGLVVMITLWPYGRLIVEKDRGVGDAFSASWRLTTDNLLVSVLVFLTYAGMLLTSLVVPFLGSLLAVPFVAVLHSVAYLHMNKEFVTGTRRQF